MSAGSRGIPVSDGVEQSENRGHSKSLMPEKVASWLKTQWFPVITVIGFIIQGIYQVTYADRERDRIMAELQEKVAPVQEIRSTVTLHTNDISELKRTVFRTERTLSTMQRNLDRMVWVTDELARKNGIIPPKMIGD